jgi:integrase
MQTIYSNPWGFGIHSPFVYKLVTRGLFKRKAKSAEKINPEWHLNFRQKRKLIRILNLIEYFGTDKINLVDRSIFPGLRIMEILQNGISDKKEDHCRFPGTSTRMSIGIDSFRSLPEASEEDIWIVTDLKNPLNRNLFSEKQHNPLVSITIETCNMGIIIFNSSFQKQNYHIRCWLYLC